MTKLCDCNLKIKRTIISFNKGYYGIEYGVEEGSTEHKIGLVTENRHEILLPGTVLCPHLLPDKYHRPKHFTVILI